MITWFQRFKHFFSTHRRKLREKPIDLIEVTPEDYTQWWNHYLIENEQSRYWQIGSRVILLDHFNDEWHLTSYQGQLNLSNPPNSKEQIDTIYSPSIPSMPSKPSIPVRTKTITTQQHHTNEVVFKPGLPDRPVVFSIGKPFILPAKEGSQLYASTPLWVSVSVGKHALLDEIPLEILQETWHGKNTLEGEVCYFAPTPCTFRLEEIAKDTTHSITPLVILNHTRKPISLKEIRIPIPNLSIYTDCYNRLWTERVIITFEADDLMIISIIKGPPKGLKDPTRISSARTLLKSGFKGLF